MKRYDFSPEDHGSEMHPRSDGDYVLYTDHCEAMKRIAAAAVEQGPRDADIEAWAEGFIRAVAYNRSAAVQIATEAAKWVRSVLAANRAKKLDGDLLETIREVAKMKSEGAITKDGRAVFINYGDSEQQMIDAAAVACPACGGSGHVGDVSQDMQRVIKERLSPSVGSYANPIAALTPPRQMVADSDQARDAAWFALVDGAAAALEDAANHCGTLDSERAALGAANHYREAAQELYESSKCASTARCFKCGHAAHNDSCVNIAPGMVADSAGGVLTDERILSEWDRQWGTAEGTISIRKVVCATVRAMLDSHAPIASPALTDKQIIEIARKAAPPFPWGIGTTRDIFLQAARALLAAQPPAAAEVEKQDLQAAFESIAGKHGITIEPTSALAKKHMGSSAPIYKYQHSNDMFALCRDFYAAMSASKEGA